MKLLIGDTGLVGKNLLQQKQFDYTYNSSNIKNLEVHARHGDELYLSCLPAAKWMVSQNLKQDLLNIQDIVNHIRKLGYSKIVLISTIDVYNDSPAGVNEDYSPNIAKLSYGANRYLFELMIREMVRYDVLQIFRLPALYGPYLKKNVVYDLLNKNNPDQINANSAYQWYNLNDLSEHIDVCNRRHPGETIFNLFPEPIETQEIINLFPGVNPQHRGRMEYNYKTKFTRTGYLYDRQTSLTSLQNYINEASCK